MACTTVLGFIKFPSFVLEQIIKNVFVLFLNYRTNTGVAIRTEKYQNVISPFEMMKIPILNPLLSLYKPLETVRVSTIG